MGQKEMAMTGRNRIMIYGPKNDGTYVVEFRTAAGEALAISIPRSETAVIQRSVRNLSRASLFRKGAFITNILHHNILHNNILHNNSLRASPTREANLMRWREILRSSSCAPISLRRLMIAVSERICRCATVMSSCAVIGDTRARECLLAPTPRGAFLWDRRAWLIPLETLVTG